MNSLQQMIKDLNNGFSYCQACSSQIKNKMLTAHINGRKHREALAMAQRKSGSAKKRNAEDEASEQEINSKRIKKDQNGDSSSGKYELRTPWQIQETDSQSLPDNKQQSSSKLIDGLPMGFFDDEKLNNRVRETVEQQKQMSTELDRFYKEVEELDMQQEDDQNEIESALQNDIEVIEEQIERWKAVNELEKKKEAIIETVATTKFDQQPNFDAVEAVEIDEDFSFDTIDWRTKNFK